MKKIVALFISLLWASVAQAALSVDVSGAQTNPIPIAITAFTGENNTIADIIAKDLESSGLFQIVPETAFLEEARGVDTVPAFVNWQAIQTQALVQGTLTRQDDKWQITFRMWDIFAEQEKTAKVLTTDEHNIRHGAHIISDLIYQAITGEKGYFDTRIFYVAESGPAKKRIKRLAVMDLDGEHAQYLTDGSSVVITPRVSPDMTSLAYLSYKKGKPRIYLMDLATKTERLLGDFEGMTFAPRFSPDGKSLLLTQAKRGNSDIYLYNLESGQQTRLTTHSAIDTSPCFSPDGKKIVFSSDRSGRQQLYVMDANGENAKRISFGEKGNYATPVWSPRGDYIAFTKIQDGTFYIGVMRTDGSGERLIAKGFLVEGPSWAPNGRAIMYFRQTPSSAYADDGETGIYTINVTGHNERRIKTPLNASDPNWSGSLH
ncbi:MAG: Tol-Pal system protein TolB [Alphaproteobacteria bacterium]|nr:Tol-Pal system protein TolB [Alphaproteobacteria bacterium]